jgi:Transcription termination and cleavage factor C-terminal
MVMQVLTATQAQIDGLAETERNAIMDGNVWRYIGRILRCIIVFFPARIIIVQTLCIHISNLQSSYYLIGSRK